MTPSAPWLKHYADVPRTLEYPDASMYEMLWHTWNKYPNYTALHFMGKNTTYSELHHKVFCCAAGLRGLGIKPDQRVTICMPNCPQGVIMFYAVNMVGAVANMIHPLSGEGEIAFYLRDADSRVVLTLDQFYPKFAAISDRVEIDTIIIANIGEALSPLMRLGYKLPEGRKIAPVPKADRRVLLWRDLVIDNDWDYYKEEEIEVLRGADDPAAILYSGGTTGTTKGILLSNMNFNALGLQIINMAQCFEAGNKMLAVMPMFHGFGLGCSIHAMLVGGSQCILIPRFNAKTYAELLKKHRPNYIVGVPTLYEALLRNPAMDGVDLSCLLGVFSGGDSLSVELKKRFDAFLAAHGAKVTVREGYGTTECVTASCLTPIDEFREGSIGIPFPDMYFKIVRVGTEDEVPYGEEGEICLAGPTVMMEYIYHPEETDNTLRTHADGMTWVHTGDLGLMDSDGFIYFRQRIKRVIISSGYNVYPSQIENILDAHEYVHASCVIGVKDPYRIQRVKAFVVLRPGIEASEEVKAEILEYCDTKIAKYALPHDIEFRAELPRTLVGKVAYRILEEEENRNTP
jgi:long-chain acyl-CoA synthetase